MRERNGPGGPQGQGAPADASATKAALGALRRVAFLLERARADEHRSAAFRGAARVIEDLPAGELMARAATRSLTDLPGIGARTAEVVTAAVRGERIEYLDRLEQEAGPAPQAGAGLRSQLRGDLHVHTDASDGSSSLREMVLAAAELGHEYLAITDHSPRLTIAHGLNAARLRAQLAEIAELRSRLGLFRVLSGIEVDILDDGSLDQDDALLDELDVVVASVHSRLRTDRAAMTRRMLAAVRNPRVDVLGQCTGRRLTGKQRPPQRVRRGCGLRRVRRARHGGRDQLTPGPARPAARAARGGDRGRRARPVSRPRGRHLAGRTAARLDAQRADMTAIARGDAQTRPCGG